MEIWQQNALVNIAAVLSQSEMSQAAFAKKAKLNANHLNMVLKGKRPITRQLVTAIASATARQTDWFYDDHSKPKAGIAPVPSDVLDAIERGVKSVLSARLPSTESHSENDEIIEAAGRDIVEALARSSDKTRNAVRIALGIPEVRVARQKKQSS